ncbi:unnamed protein product [Closterium sp. NIES-54]
MFKHMSGSLPAPEAPAEPAADAREEVWTQYRGAHIAHKQWMARDVAAKLRVCAHLSLNHRANFCQVPSAHAFYTSVGPGTTPPLPPTTLGCLALPLTFPALSDLATVADQGGCAVPAEALLLVPVTLADPTSGLVYAHPSTVLSCLVVPSDSSGSSEGGDPAAANTATSRRSPRLETPPGFPPRVSSPPLQPDAVDFGGPDVVGGDDAEGAGSGGAVSGGAGSGGADSGGATSPLVGGLGGTGTRGATSGGALQSLPQWPIFLEQPSSSLPEPTPTCTTPPLLFPPPDLSRPLLPPNSPMSAPPRYSPFPISLTRCRVPLSCAASPTTSCVTREPVVLPLPPPSPLPAILDPVSDLARAAHPTIPCCLAARVTPRASSTVAELAGFAATCRRAYLAGLVFASSCPPSVGGELAVRCDVLEERQFELEYLSYPLSIRTRYVAPGRHHPAHLQAARRVLRYLVRLSSRT